jgi:uncharacterized protein Yka (UPF0111/DUF47 family)
LVGRRKAVVELEQTSDRVVSSLAKQFPESNVAVDGFKLTIDMAEADRWIPDIVDTVVRAGGRVHSAGVVGSTLEDTYLKLVRREK